MKIGINKVVTMNYTLKNDEGIILDTSEGKQPMTYLHGVGGLIPGLEVKLNNKIAGDKLNVIVAPEHAYGSRSDEFIKVVPKSGFQSEGDEQLIEGMQVQMQTEQGPAIALVSKIKDEEVTLDLNHPLADVTLHFDVEIVSVREANKEEISHGHVHGEGGHQH